MGPIWLVLTCSFVWSQYELSICTYNFFMKLWTGVLTEIFDSILQLKQNRRIPCLGWPLPSCVPHTNLEQSSRLTHRPPCHWYITCVHCRSIKCKSINFFAGTIWNWVHSRLHSTNHVKVHVLSEPTCKYICTIVRGWHQKCKLYVRNLP
jgi:hypothetical protein